MNKRFICSGVLALAVAGAWPVAAVSGTDASPAQSAPRDVPYPGLLTINVDFRDAPHKIYRVHETIPVKPGPFTLYYPKWGLPFHAPSGPIANITGLIITANGKQLAWRRDLLDMYTLHMDVPEGVSNLDLAFQYADAGPHVRAGFKVWAAPHLMDVAFGQVSFYPAGYYSRDVRIQPTVTLPTGWKFATALEVEQQSGNTIQFKPLTFNNFDDSPLIAGEHFRRVDLAPGGKAPVHLDIVADSENDLQISDKQIAYYRDLVKQLYALFHSRHFDHYDLLLTLTDHLGGDGLEHHQSSLNITRADFFTNPKSFMTGASLMPHEFTHSWNGKFRRPADLWTPNLNMPEKGDLLWVYEGLTEYWSTVLAARSGLWSPDEYRAALASVAASMSHRTGRRWRPLQDTADAVQILYGSSSHWVNYRRAVDYYPEGELLWLDVDSKIRELSHNRRSLDDFAKAFYSMDDGSYVTKTYTFEDVVNTLNQVQPFDWAKFLRQRLDYTGPDLPEHGIERSGWKLVYTKEESDYDKAASSLHHVLNLTYSAGLSVAENGEVIDVQWDSPAYAAGVIPGMRVVAVNGSQYSGSVLRNAVEAATTDNKPIQLLVDNEDTYENLALDYHGGLKYPHLVPEPGKPDLLRDIITARK